MLETYCPIGLCLVELGLVGLGWVEKSSRASGLIGLGLVEVRLIRLILVHCIFFLGIRDAVLVY